LRASGPTIATRARRGAQRKSRHQSTSGLGGANSIGGPSLKARVLCSWLCQRSRIDLLARFGGHQSNGRFLYTPAVSAAGLLSPPDQSVTLNPAQAPNLAEVSGSTVVSAFTRDRHPVGESRNLVSRARWSLHTAGLGFVHPGRRAICPISRELIQRQGVSVVVTPWPGRNLIHLIHE